jgi:hypothetical protein
MQLASWQEDAISQPSVTHDAIGLIVLATVGVASQAGIALATVQIRFNAAPHAWLQMAYVAAHLQNLDAQFMSRNPRKIKVRKFSQVAGHIRPTHPHAMDTN